MATNTDLGTPNVLPSSTRTLPTFTVVTLPAAGTLQEVSIGRWITHLSFRPRGADVKLLWNGAVGGAIAGVLDGAAIGGTPFLTMPSNTWTRILITRSWGAEQPELESIFLTDAVGGTVVEILAESETSRN